MAQGAGDAQAGFYPALTTYFPGNRGEQSKMVSVEFPGKLHETLGLLNGANLTQARFQPQPDVAEKLVKPGK